jgi:hypothetical protein
MTLGSNPYTAEKLRTEMGGAAATIDLEHVGCNSVSFIDVLDIHIEMFPPQ